MDKMQSFFNATIMSLTLNCSYSKGNNIDQNVFCFSYLKWVIHWKINSLSQSLQFYSLLQIPGVYTSVLERLIVVQMDGFPQYSAKMQPVCCHSIVKLFIALAGKGPVLWSVISTVGQFQSLHYNYTILSIQQNILRDLWMHRSIKSAFSSLKC